VTDAVVDVGIRSELCATLTRSPLLRRLDECPTDPLPAGIRDNVPALELGNAISRAAVHDIANREFYKSDRRSVGCQRQEDFRRFAAVASEVSINVLPMLREAAVRPQSMSHSQPLVSICRCHRSDHAYPL
jgi:hypothetical protein